MVSTLLWPSLMHNGPVLTVLIFCALSAASIPAHSHDYAGTLASCKEKAVEYSRILLQHAPLTKAQRATAAGDEGKLQAMDL